MFSSRLQRLKENRPSEIYDELKSDRVSYIDLCQRRIEEQALVASADAAEAAAKG